MIVVLVTSLILYSYNPFGSDSSDGEEDEDHTPPQPVSHHHTGGT